MTRPVSPADVAAIIPAYREERHIREVASETKEQVGTVIVVDDGSPDATEARAKEGGAEVIRHPKNRGKGAAIKTGIEALLKGPSSHFILLDADGQHLPAEIARFIEKVNQSDPPMIVGSRMSSAEKMPLVRRLTNRFMSWQISRVCGQAIPDTQCGFRMIRRDIAPLLFCKTDSYDYETEMLFVVSRAGHTISSVPVSTIYADEVSKIRPIQDTLRFFKLLSRYR